MENPQPPASNGGRLVLVSNRLPVTIRETEDNIDVRLSSGGLATGLSTPHRETNGLWIGWPGTVNDEAQIEPRVEEALAARGLVGVGLTSEEKERYYHGLCNSGIWPLFHYFPHDAKLKSQDWESYKAVNERFAAAALAHLREDDIVFVHDFHLFLVPALLRAAMPKLRIGFFLHIPFPSSEMFRLLPWREEMLRGMLGADFIGFHTLDYARHFQYSLLRVLGVDSRGGRLPWEGRYVESRALPLGIDAEAFEQRVTTDGARLEYERVLEAARGRRILLGVDRLDYTKGIPERMLAFERLLERRPELIERVFLVQIAVPSRVEVEQYRDLKDEIDQLVGRINSRFGRPGMVPIHYLYRSIPQEQLAALYRAADVALVTPLRDGLNLVAKEYCACRTDGDGALVLSEFVGASWEMGEAMFVNPWDIDGTATAIEQALELDRDERMRRMALLRARVKGHDVHYWVRECLTSIRAGRPASLAIPLQGSERSAFLEEWAQARKPVLFIDYDGTLRGFVGDPAQARPTEEILGALRELAALEDVPTYVISGRDSTELEEWLGGSGVGLVSEHGAYLLEPDGKGFRTMFELPEPTWRTEVREVLEQVCERVPGSRIEEKRLGMAWHWREADARIAGWQARELVMHLSEVFANRPISILQGDRVIEVRPAVVDKGQAALHLLAKLPGVDFLLGCGDDMTDEELFRVLPSSTHTVLVGNRPTAARWRVNGPDDMLELLRQLARTRTTAQV